MNNSELPEKIFAVEYGGFFDFNESGMYEDASLLDRDSYPDAEVISNEIAKRYNNYDNMKEALEGMCKYWEWTIKDPHFEEYRKAKQLLDSLK